MVIFRLLPGFYSTIIFVHTHTHTVNQLVHNSKTLSLLHGKHLHYHCLVFFMISVLLWYGFWYSAEKCDANFANSMKCKIGSNQQNSSVAREKNEQQNCTV